MGVLSIRLYVLNMFLLLSVCPPQQRKESETQCQTDSKFDLEVVESNVAVAMENRFSEYVSRYFTNYPLSGVSPFVISVSVPTLNFFQLPLLFQELLPS